MFAILCGSVAVICSFFLIQQKSHGGMLILKLICDVLWITYFALIGAYSGMAISVIGALRELSFLGVRKRDKNCWWLLGLFLLAEAVGVALTWENAWSICSLISGMLSTVAFSRRDTDKSKVLLAVVCISQFVYACHHGSVFAMVNECITAVSLCLACGRHWMKVRQINRKELRNVHKTV